MTSVDYFEMTKIKSQLVQHLKTKFSEKEARRRVKAILKLYLEDNQ